MNRIAMQIAKFKTEIARRIEEGATTAEKVEEFRKLLDMPLMDYANFQELKSLASMNGKLTLEEAQLIYSYLGEIPDTFNAQPFEVKFILSKIHEELLTMRVEEKQRQ